MTNQFYLELLVYLGPLLFIWWVYGYLQHRRHTQNRKALQSNIEAGLTEPVSLHPIINESRCIGCGSCVKACPEGDILGLIDLKAHLINPTHCIGHGACKAACPIDAIDLVFGTATRGVDIPTIKPNFETNIPGIFIAGELGGMGLIRNAIEQGRQAVDAIRKLEGVGQGNELDLVIVGAGPAGFAATLAAQQHNLRYVTVEQDSLGGCVFQYPRGKIVMTAPVDLPMVGKVKMKETTKEALLRFWQEAEQKTGIKINYYERMESVTPMETGFMVNTAKDSYRARAVLLTIGRRGTPRKLEVPGEELPKVVYQLIDAEQYRDQHILVVGGGDSALEAATSLAEQPGTTVTLSYRAEAFSRAREKNRDKVDEAAETGRLKVLLKSGVLGINEKTVLIEHEGQTLEIPNDVVIICAGGVLPTPFLKQIGIEVNTKFGEA